MPRSEVAVVPHLEEAALGVVVNRPVDIEPGALPGLFRLKNRGSILCCRVQRPDDALLACNQAIVDEHVPLRADLRRRRMIRRRAEPGEEQNTSQKRGGRPGWSHESPSPFPAQKLYLRAN